MTARYSFVSSVVLGLVIATSAFAGWGPDGATIKATTNNIAKLTAANDGAYGSFVVWQEESSGGSGVLRAQHVLATGDVDPAWASDGLLLCNVSTSRAALGMVPDGLGGAYVWWKENALLFLSRIAPNGVVASGWPARGRQIGTTYPAAGLPSAIADAANGIYVTWVAAAAGPDAAQVLATHIGPANTSAGGWVNGVRGLSGSDPVVTLEYWPHAALAPDGGLFVAWASWSLDTEQVPSAYRLRRVTTAGLNASGWDPAGLSLGEFHGELIAPYAKTGLVGLSEDGAGGAFAMIGLLSGSSPNPQLDTRLLRLQGDGATAAGWPVDGLAVNNGGYGQYGDVGSDASYRVLADGLGGAQVGEAQYATDGGTSYQFAAALPGGGWKPSSTANGGITGGEVVVNASGGVFFASFYPKGPYQMYDPYAYLRVSQSLAPAGWNDFLEIHFDPLVTFYGDIGLAESGDGGAIFYWSQVRERFGLFARRFNGAGQVTGVTPGAEVAALSLGRMRFVAGEGVRASFAVPAGTEASLALYDVGGRRVASSRIAAGAREATMPGTSRLASGLYFAKLATARETAAGRVVVAR